MLGVILVVALAVLLLPLKFILSSERAEADLEAEQPAESTESGRPLYPFEGHMEPPSDPPRASCRIPDERAVAQMAESVRIAERDALYDRRSGFNWWLARPERLHALVQLQEKWYGHEDEEL